MAILVPSEWKEVKGTNGSPPDPYFDLVDGTMKLVENAAGEIEVWQGGTTAWGTSGSQASLSTSEVEITGRHHSGKREFVITCTLKPDGTWRHDGVLDKSGGGGDGTWTAEEGP